MRRSTSNKRTFREYTAGIAVYSLFFTSEVVMSKKIDKVLQYKSDIAEMGAKIKELKLLMSADLEDVEAECGKSFEYDGRYYAIRNRAGNRFMVSSAVPFGSWKKSRKE